MERTPACASLLGRCWALTAVARSTALSCPPAPRPGGRTRITLEEAEATAWSLESRLHRAGETGARVMHKGDNAPCLCAMSKGRSSSQLLNSRCLRAMTITLAGKLMPFFFWVRSADNPAGRPSRICGGDDGPLVDPPARGDVSIHTPQAWTLRERVFIHLCGGPRRADRGNDARFPAGVLSGLPNLL